MVCYRSNLLLLFVLGFVIKDTRISFALRSFFQAPVSKKVSKRKFLRLICQSSEEKRVFGNK